MLTLVLSTRNNHKVGEIQAVLGDAYRYLSLDAIPDAPEIVEDGETFADNARKKAEVLAAWLTSFPELHEGQEAFVVADDSGLEVDALDGAPGVRSARYAAEELDREGNASDEQNNAKLLRELEARGTEDRRARFRCVIALATAGAKVGDEATKVFEGTCEGQILEAARGEAGFGYDPLFLPNGYEETFAELGETAKNKISHRAQALARLRAWLESRAAP